MKAVVCAALGEPLSVEDIPTPDVSTGMVRVSVRAAGVNFADTLIVRGLYQVKPPLPFTPGSELAGIVSAVGEGVSEFAVGDRVLAFVPHGAFAEEVVAAPSMMRRLPASMPFETAAAFAIAYGTAHLALLHRGRLKAGETLAVTGAAGGVGLAAVELGKVLGARVIAVVSNAAKGALATSRGADQVVDLSKTDLRTGLRLASGGDGVDVVLDNVGGDGFETCLRSLRWDGRLLVVGFASGEIPKVPMNLPLVKNASVVGVYWGATFVHEPAAITASFDGLFAMWEASKIRPFVSERFPLERAGEALGVLSGRKALGKVVIVP